MQLRLIGMVALFSVAGRIRLAFENRAQDNACRHCWHPSMPTYQRESDALPVRHQFRLARILMGYGDDTHSARRDRRLSRTPLTAGRYCGLVLATPGNGRQRWRHLLAGARF